MTSNMTRKYSWPCWHSCLMRVNSIIKIESTVNAAARSYVVILTLFIEVFGVIYWHLSYMKEKKLCPYGCLIPCTAYYTFRKLKQSSWSQRPSANFLWKTAHFSCLPLSCWFETFSECSELEHYVCKFFFVYVCVDLSVYVCMC